MHQIVDPQTLTLNLGGRWLRRYGSAPCPICQSERRKGQNALTIAESGGRLLLNCKKSDCDFCDLLTACGIAPGHFEIDFAAIQQAKRERDAAEANAQRKALNIWNQGKPIGGTLGEAYLRGRSITCDLPETLRWLPNIYHGPSGRTCAAMLAQIQRRDGQPTGIHRTFFTTEGNRLDKAVSSDGTHKMMLGPCQGRAVRLIATDGPLVVAEGIETALSLASGLLRHPATVWAALSTSGIIGLDLPSEVGRLIIAADGDEAGKTAATRLATRASRLGWQVSLLPAPTGHDWNDVLRQEVHNDRP